MLALLVKLDARDVVPVDAEVLLAHLLGVIGRVISGASFCGVRVRLRAMAVVIRDGVLGRIAYLEVDVVVQNDIGTGVRRIATNVDLLFDLILRVETWILEGC